MSGMVSGRRRENRLCVIAIAIVLAWYAYSNVRSNSEWVKKSPKAYYELLTEAVVLGQTHLKLEPDPRLKTLTNPWAGGQGIPRAHDATYYHGRYYLYFGVAPVVVLYAPWRILTGTYLADGAGTGIFCTVGFLLAAAFYVRCKRRFFPELAAGWTAVFILTLGLGSFVQFELRSSEFYQVPIACAFALGMGSAHALLTAAGSERVRSQIFGIAVASGVGALAVGARPNHLFGLAGLAIVASWLWWRQVRSPEVGRSGALSLALAAIVPAALVGAGLASYNYLRFGSVTEFGLTYQFAAVDMRTITLLSWSHVRNAVEGYVFAGREYSRYFPFIRQTTDNIGVVPWAPFALLALAFPLTWISPRWRNRAWVLGVGGPLTVTLAIFGSLLGYFYVFDRYVMDFLPGSMLVASLTVSVFLVSKIRSRVWRISGRGLVGLLLSYTFVHSAIHGLPSGTDRAEVRWLARVLNYGPYWYERLTGFRYGAVEAQVQFAEGSTGVSEPLVVTAGGRDLIYIKYLGPRRAQLGFFHMGAGGPLSEPFDFEPNRRYRLRVDLGSLYPPAAHAAYRGWTESEIMAVQRRVDVRLDDRRMLFFSSAFHQAEPDSLELGRNRESSTDLVFRGSITAVERLDLPERSALAAENKSGPVRLTLRFPPFIATFGQPLISTGKTGAGDLFYVFYVGPNQVRFAHDCWSRALEESEVVTYDPSEEQVIEVDMGSLRPGSRELLEGREHLRIRFNGRVILDKPRPFHPAKPDEVYIGHNAIGSSGAEVNFNGPRLAFERLSEWKASPDTGALALTLKVPKERVGRSEPLVVTGVTGAGEIVYIRYPDAGHFQIGYDKWNFGGPLSDPIPCVEDREIELEVSLGALYGETQPSAALDIEALKKLRSTVQVRVAGQVVLRANGESYPATPRQINVGVNAIGASTCSEKFTGEILRMEHLGPARLKHLE